MVVFGDLVKRFIKSERVFQYYQRNGEKITLKTFYLTLNIQLSGIYNLIYLNNVCVYYE